MGGVNNLQYKSDWIYWTLSAGERVIMIMKNGGL